YRGNAEQLHEALEDLWQDMDRGKFSHVIRGHVKQFNGYLFKENVKALPIRSEHLEVLIVAAKANWKQVEPSIFGSLLEKALTPKERRSQGAHFTPRAYVERLVSKTVIEPLRRDWEGV